MAIIGAISIGIYHALWVFSIVLNGAAIAVVMIYTFPTFVTLGAWLLFGERIRWPQVLALAIALLG
jgi:drug/metabolite transporter (DMT)-like permease